MTSQNKSRLSQAVNSVPFHGQSNRNRMLAVEARFDRQRPVLTPGRSKTIGLIIQHTTMDATSRLVQSIGAAAADAKMHIVVKYIYEGDAREALQRAVAQFAKAGVAGLVIAPMPMVADAGSIVSPQMPVVTVGGSPTRQWPDVSIDQFAAGRMATHHLLGHGHQAVWLLDGPRNSPDANSLVAGWRTALAEVGKPSPSLRTDGTLESAYECGLEMARSRDCTAVLTGEYFIAVGLMRGMREVGRRIPEDVSLICIGDELAAAYLQPPLTTVDCRYFDVGREALRILLRSFAKEAPNVEFVSIRPALCSRGSVARPNKP